MRIIFNIAQIFPVSGISQGIQIHNIPIRLLLQNQPHKISPNKPATACNKYVHCGNIENPTGGPVSYILNMKYNSNSLWLPFCRDICRIFGYADIMLFIIANFMAGRIAIRPYTATYYVFYGRLFFMEKEFCSPNSSPAAPPPKPDSPGLCVLPAAA